MKKYYLHILCLFFFFLLLADPLSANAKDDLFDKSVLLLDFNDSVTDSSPLAHPVKVFGQEEYAEGIDGNAFSFDGATYLDLGNDAMLQPANITISMWIKPTSYLVDENMLFWCKEDKNFQGDGWYLSCLSNQVPLKLSVGAAPNGLPTEAYVEESRRSFFPVNKWTHIAVTYNSETKLAVFYRNGELLKTSYVNSSLLELKPTVDHKYLGYNSPGYDGAYANMLMDDVQIFSTDANAEQISSLYHGIYDSYEETVTTAAFWEKIKFVLLGSLLVILLIGLVFLIRFAYKRFISHVSEKIIETSKEKAAIPTVINENYIYLTVAILKLDVTEKSFDMDAVEQRLSTYLNGLLLDIYEIESECIVTPDKDHSFFIAIHSDKKIEQLTVDQEKRTQFDHFLKSMLQEEYTIGMSESAEEKGQLYKIYLQAAAALDYRFLYGKNELISYEEIEHRPDAYESNQTYIFETMEHYVKSFEETSAEAVLTALCEKLIRKDASIVSYQKFRNDLTLQFEALYLKYNDEMSAYEIHIEYLIRCETFQEFISALANALNKLKTNLLQKIQEQTIVKIDSDSIAAKSAAYMKEHFSDSELNLNQLGEIFHITPSYLSKQFKDAYGKSVADYLTDYRIEQAKTLLRSTDKTVEQIAKEVGYLSSSVFIRMFKKCEDQTPGSFRKGSTI